MPPIKILAISGSLRPNSSNGAIINKIASLTPADISFTIYNGLGALPHFNPDLDNASPPPSVTDLRKQLADTDAVLICTPEYAFGVPGSLKNMLDWTVSSCDFVNKPTALITASSVGMHAHASLLLTLGAISAKIADDAELLIPFILTKVNTDGSITDEETLASLKKVLNALIKSIG